MTNIPSAHEPHPLQHAFLIRCFSSARKIYTYLHDNLGEAEPGIVADLVREPSGQHDHLAQIGQQPERPPRASAQGEQLAGAEDEGEFGPDAAYVVEFGRVHEGHGAGACAAVRLSGHEEDACCEQGGDESRSEPRCR